MGAFVVEFLAEGVEAPLLGGAVARRWARGLGPEIDPSQPHDLFSVLGTVSGFRTGAAILNRNDFEVWLLANEDPLKRRIASWIPDELSNDDRAALLAEMKDDCLREIDAAVRPGTTEAEASPDDDAEDAPEEGEERPRQGAASSKLLDRLLYRGVLPRYAFPTDVATFHVFDRDRSTGFRAIMRFAPSQGLPIALTQYAPGKQIWISGKCYTSGAIYSVMRDERYDAWQAKRLYLECSECGFARTFDVGAADRGDTRDCEACGAQESFGPARYWLRPPGFAHPIDVDEVTSPDDMPETSYATRAKLTMPTPADEGKWIQVNDRIRVLKERKYLLVSNTGPGNEGYSYCTKCGRIEASSDPNPILLIPHRKPYPDDKQPACEGNGTTRHVVLGTDFITDIALFSLRVAAPLKLKPGYYPTDVALRTVSEALAKAGSQILEIEPGELMAEYRPALTPAGRNGFEVEIFLYDTLPGGAGFSSQLVNRGKELFQRALRLVKTCPENCDASCYRCLRSFKNKFEHSLIDRHVGTELLEYLLTSALHEFDPQRMKNSTSLLYSDLLRQGDGGVDFESGVRVTAAGAGHVEVPILATRRDGQRFVIALSGPLMADRPGDPSIREMREDASDIQVIVINELLVRGNLPAATREVQQRLGA